MSESPASRQAALAVLEEVLRRRQPLDAALAAHLDRAAPALADRDKALARLLVMTVLRRLGQIDDLLSATLDRPLDESPDFVRQALRIGCAQVLFLELPGHAAVDTAVGLVRQKPLRGLVNAVLRRLAREGRERMGDQDPALLNTPAWLRQRWRACYGDATARAIAEAHLREPPLDLSVKDDRQGWAERLAARLLPTGSLRRVPGGRIEALPGYAQGAWWVQDAAAALPVALLGPVAGRRVVELCAAPGGKTAQLALAGAEVTAVDRGAKRLERLAANLDRLGLECARVQADAAQWRPRAPADAVLLDAPCSGTGTIRRHPDIPYLKSAADITRFAELQRRLLAAATEMLAPGGTLVYSVCSLEPEEGPELVAAALDAGMPLARVPIAPSEVGGQADFITPSGDLRTLPSHWTDLGGLDGFYAARFTKR